MWNEREENQGRTGEEGPTHKRLGEEEEVGVVREVGGKPAGSGLTEGEEGKSHPRAQEGLVKSGKCYSWGKEEEGGRESIGFNH